MQKILGITSISFSKDRETILKLKKIFKGKIIVNTKKRRFKKNELLNFMQKCDYAIIGLDNIDKNLLANCTKLKVISKYGVGLDNIDFNACKKYGVKVVYPKGINKRSVSEEVLGSMLSLIRNLYVSSNNLKNSKWLVNGGQELTKKTVGIIGVGNVGKDLINLLKPFNCRILVNDIVNQSRFYKSKGLIKSSKREIFSKSDIVTVHTPLTSKTKNFINKNSFNIMKKTAFIINTARGGIVNQSDLKYALIKKKIAGAAIDVYEQEPPKDMKLLKLPNLMCMPHIGGNSTEAVSAMGLAAINNLIKVIK
jgi:phosphoglycerate dehydrogenase-like enzyme